MISRLMNAYGILMFLGVIAAAAKIEDKSTNLIISCLAVGFAAVAIGWLRQKRNDNWLLFAGRILPLAAFVLFAYKAGLNLLALIGIVQNKPNYDAYSKCINVTILIFLAAASLCTYLIVVTLDKTRERKEDI